MDNHPKTNEEIKQELKRLQHDFSFLQSLKNIDDAKRNQLKKELAVALKEIASQNKKAEKLAADLIITNLNIKFENNEKLKRAAELIIANIELAFQNREKEKRAAELIIANKELVFQNEEKEKRADELIIANKELIFQNEEKAKRAAELVIANKELALLNKQIEKGSKVALKENENRLRAYVEQASDALFVHDFSGKFIDVNRRACETLGYSKEELLDMSVFDVEMDFDLEKAQKNWSQIENNQQIMLLGRQRRKDGSVFPVEVSFGIFDMNDKRYFLKQARDITERKQAEEKLKENYALLNIAGEVAKLGGWNVNLEENRSYWSDEVAAIHEMPAGYAPLVEEGINFYAPEWRDKITEVFTNCVQKGISYDEDMEILTASGKKVWVRTIGEAVRDFKGKIVKIQGAFQDISERKKAEESLKKSEEEFRTLAESMPQIVWTTRADGWNTYFNQQWMDYTGLTLEESNGHGWNIPFHPDDQQRSWDAWQNAVNNQGSYSIEVRLRRFDGEYRWWLIRGVPILNNEGEILKWFGTCTDIEEIKIAEELLLKSKQEYQSFFEDDLTGDFISTLDGEILNCNAAYLKICGFSSKEEALNFDVRKLYVHKDQRNNITERLKKGERVTYYEADLKRLDGKLVHVIGNMVGGFNKEGNLQTLKGYILDDTERKLAVDELRKLSAAVEQSPATVLMTDLKGNIEYVNKKFTKVTGYSRKDVIGKNPRIFNSGHQSKELYEQLWQNITSGKDWFGEMLNKKKDGSLYWEQASISSIKNDEGKITHFLGVKEDITEKKESEIKLINALEKAKESDRLKSAFLANMSHEIRTPMNGILGFSGLLNSPDLSSNQRQKYIKVIEKSGARLLTTINDIMNISKIESGLMKISLSEINLKNEIEELYEFFKLETENKGLQLLVVNSIPEDEFIIKTDKEKLHSILVNLIKNAIKYTKQGSVEFGCSKKGNQLKFYVKDTGIGIPLERQPYVFDRFVQADIEDKAVYEGSGLGLAISKSYVEMLGSTIELESVEGIGSTFSFTIPCEIINKEILLAKKEPSTDFVVLETPALKILIVEDDMIAQLYLEELLSDVSKEILLADNGYKALDLYRENSDIDLILMDIRVPKINGHEVTKQIRQFNKEVIIIAQTAFAFSEDREKALKAGCNDYISKPINKLELELLIQKYFNK